MPSCTTVVGIPAKAVQQRQQREEAEPRFVAYGTPTGESSDPVSRAIDGLLDEVRRLRARVGELEHHVDGGGAVERLRDTGNGEEEEAAAAKAQSGEC